MKNHSTSDTRKALLEDVDQLKRSATQIAQDVRDHASAHVDETKERVSDLFEAAKENLTTHPLTLLGIGFGVGLLFGLRLRR